MWRFGTFFFPSKQPMCSCQTCKMPSMPLRKLKLKTVGKMKLLLVVHWNKWKETPQTNAKNVFAKLFWKHKQNRLKINVETSKHGKTLNPTASHICLIETFHSRMCTWLDRSPSLSMCQIVILREHLIWCVHACVCERISWKTISEKAICHFVYDVLTKMSKYIQIHNISDYSSATWTQP